LGENVPQILNGTENKNISQFYNLVRKMCTGYKNMNVQRISRARGSEIG
jgi:hypothetical protein